MRSFLYRIFLNRMPGWLILVFTLVPGIFNNLFAQTQSPPNLIPYPQEIQIKKGNFRFDKRLTMVQNDDLDPLVQDLQRTVYELTQLNPNITRSRNIKYGIMLRMDKNMEEEAYTLSISPSVIRITGGKTGVFWGVQTFRQLIALYQNEARNGEPISIPAMFIRDAPKFAHRGLLLDVGRHYFDKRVVKKYIDLLSFYKMNTLHFHLTEDQGWRLASEKYPKLQKIAAWRLEGGQKYGGYFSREDLRELVQYAAGKRVTIIPEIELPGHSQAALAAYPQFSCIGKDSTIKVATEWGVFKEIYCAGNDSTFTFLQDILTEVMQIFPSEYIHIGGDEVPKYRWEHCKKCQKRINNEGLKDEHELQSYFIRRIDQFLQTNNRKMIGWEEIREGGGGKNAIIQSWMGMEAGEKAAMENQFAIMSPTSHCYLDYGLEKIDLAKVYSFDPIPKSLPKDKQKYILGGELNMWTEHVPDERTLDRRINPRLQAMAEVLWTYPITRDFKGFYRRLQFHYPYLKRHNITYGEEAIPASIQTTIRNEKVLISVDKNLPDLTLQLVWNGEQVASSEPLELKESGTLHVVARKNDQPYGDTLSQHFEHHIGLAKKVGYVSQISKWYTGGGENALVDGKTGSLNFKDGNWQGFSGTDVEFSIDLGSVQTVNSVGSNFYHYNNAWIFAPEFYKVSYSENGTNWTEFGTSELQTDPKKRGQHTVLMDVENKVNCRYIKVAVKSIGKVPDWHQAAGSDAWIFIDEVIVR